MHTCASLVRKWEKDTNAFQALERCDRLHICRMWSSEEILMHWFHFGKGTGNWEHQKSCRSWDERNRGCTPKHCPLPVHFLWHQMEKEWWLTRDPWLDIVRLVPLQLPAWPLGKTPTHKKKDCYPPSFLLSLFSPTVLLLDREARPGNFSEEGFLEVSVTIGLKGSRPTQTSTAGQCNSACMLSIWRGDKHSNGHS